MIAAFPILFGSLFTVTVCLAIGLAVLHRCRAVLYREEELPLALVIGAALLNLVVFMLAILQLAYTWVFLITGVALIGAAASLGACRLAERRFDPLPRFQRWLLIGVMGVFGVLYFCYAMAPEMSPDGSTYHLGLVARYLRNHGLERITTHMYANLSQGVEMLFLFAFSFGRHSAAAMVQAAFLFALPFSMLSYARRYGFPEAGVAGALFFFVSPVVGIDGSTAYNDVATAAVLFTLFYLLRIWADSRSDRLLVAVGLVAGYTFAVKYTAALGIPFALGFVAWKLFRQGRLRLRPLLIVGFCALLLVAPWMIRDAVWLDNPVSPFFNELFPNPYVHVSFEQIYRQRMRNYEGLESYWDIPAEVTLRGNVLCGLLGPLFLLAPVGLLALRWKEGRLLWLAALVFGITYATNIGTRFLIPPLPYIALAMGMVLTRVPGLAAVLVLVHALLSWPTVIPRYAHQYAWQIQGGPRWKAALRIEPEEDYLRRKFPEYEVARMVEEQVEEGGKVLTFQQIAEAYTTRETLVVYQAAWNEVLGDMLWTPFNTSAHPVREIRFNFEPRKLRRIRLMQLATGSPEHWSISELRVFRGEKELPRDARWRLRAKPNPWDVQRAFDNSPVTRWRSWEPIFNGMFVEVDFGGDQEIDSVSLLCTADQWNIKVRLDGATERGEWEIVSDEVAEAKLTPPVGMRRMVANELRRAGVRYFLIHQNDFGREDFRERPQAWGITELAELHGKRLYRIDQEAKREPIVPGS